MQRQDSSREPLPGKQRLQRDDWGNPVYRQVTLRSSEVEADSDYELSDDADSRLDPLEDISRPQDDGDLL